MPQPATIPAERRTDRQPEVGRSGQPDPRYACMLAAMSAAVYVPYVDYQNQGWDIGEINTVLIGKTLEQALTEKEVRRNLKPGQQPQAGGKYLSPSSLQFFQGFTISQTLISQASLVASEPNHWAGLVAYRNIPAFRSVTRNKLQVLIAFRGTQSTSEILRDVHVAQRETGFHNAKSTLDFGIFLILLGEKFKQP